MIIETDPRVQAMFDENLAATRRANAETTSALKTEQERLAAEARARDERFASDKAELGKQAENMGKQTEPPKKPTWERHDRSVGEMAFGPEDDEPSTPPTAPVPVFTPPPPPARPAPRRPAPRDDDDDDLSGQTWLS